MAEEKKHSKEFDAYLAIKESIANDSRNPVRKFAGKDGQEKEGKQIYAEFKKAEKYTNKNGEEKWSWAGVQIKDGQQTVELVFVPTGKDGPVVVGDKADVITWKGKGEKPDIDKRVEVASLTTKNPVLAEIVKDTAEKYPRVEKEADEPELD